MSDIDGIEKQLLDLAKGASIADLGTIATAMKSVAEAKNAELTARNKDRELKLERFKSLTALMVPLVAFLALFGTTYAQYKQIEAGRQQLEDTEWRDLLSSLKGGSDSVYSDLTVAPRLRSFFESASYQTQAKSIAGRMMGRISNPEGFADLFASVFGEVDRQNVGSILDIFRTLVTSLKTLNSQCDAIYIGASVPFVLKLTDCGSHVDENQASGLMKQFNVAPQITALRRSKDRLQVELGTINYKVGAFLQANYQQPRDPRRSPSLDLSATDFIDADMSKLDLTDFDITGAIFDRVNFAGAIITPKRRITDAKPGGPGSVDLPDFRGSAWWEALSIEPNLLAFLMQWYPPYVFDYTIYPFGYAITRAAYEPKIAALCAKAGIACPSPLRFGPLPGSQNQQVPQRQ